MLPLSGRYSRDRQVYREISINSTADGNARCVSGVEKPLDITTKMLYIKTVV
jgi:hypothetical protein